MKGTSLEEYRALVGVPKQDPTGTITKAQVRRYLKSGEMPSAQIPAAVPLEHDEQVVVLQTLALSHPRVRELTFAIPNAQERTRAERGRAIAEGMEAGVADLHTAIARCGYHSLYVEMKRRNGKRSDISAKQLKWRENLLAEGHAYYFGFGADQALEGYDLYMADDAARFDAWWRDQAAQLDL